MSKLVTIGISFYNNEKTLSYAVKSALQQSYANLEIILLNDGSKDNSLKIAEQFKSDSRVKVISDGNNKGLIARLNEIIDIAQGDFIARMDADDLMDPEKIKKQMDYFIAHPEAEVVTTGMISMDNNLNPLGKRCCSIHKPEVLKVFRNGDDLLHASMLSRTTWSRINKYATGFDRAEDRELFTRTLKSSQYYIIPEPLYFYMDAQNIDLKKFLKSYQSERKALLKNWKGSLSFFQMAGLLARSYAKSFVIRIYFLTGKQERIFTNKNQTLTANELNHAKKIIKQFTT